MMARSMEDRDKAQRILEVMVVTKANFSLLPGYSRGDPEAHNRCLAGVDCDEVYNNVFIGDMYAAQNKEYLKRLGITHVVNAAEGRGIGMVNTNAKYYEGTGIKYLGLKLMDLSVADIAKYFNEVSDFIENAVNMGGRVLVHCVMGMSRSGTLVLAWMMLKRNMSACQAMTYVRKRRNIHPNDGFLQSLAALDNKLMRRGGSSKPFTSMTHSYLP